jgi:hypothetical protein
MSDFPIGFHGRDRYGPYVVLAIDGDDRLVRYEDGREARRHISVLRLAHTNREQFDQFAPTSPATPPHPKPAKKPRRATDDDPSSFEQQEVFDVTARLIRQLTGDPPAFVSHAQLVAAFVADPAGGRLVARARELQGDHRTREAIAANMIAWFSQRITVRTSPHARDFERRKIDGAWAYRPRTRPK